MASPLRRPLIVGNWKMNLGLAESAALAASVKDAVPETIDAALCVPFTALGAVKTALSGSPVWLGAQDVFWEKSGAFTGEISAPQLVDAGCRAVLIGHSERRVLFGETDDVVRRKAKAAADAGLVCIVCVGETGAQRESRKTFAILQAQIEECSHGFSFAELSSFVVAYEPVWAIGTGKTASSAQAQEAHAFIRETLSRVHGKPAAQKTRVIYGGSVKAENIGSLMAEPDLDGALVGGESLKADSFLKIMRFQAPERAPARRS